MITKLVVASSNQGKLLEFAALANSEAIANQQFQLELLPEFAAIPPFDEKAPTFAENAAGKALHYSQFSNEYILSDDSGLVVPALGGAPGVRSARYAGPNATSEDRNAKLLHEMRDLTGDERPPIPARRCRLRLRSHLLPARARQNFCRTLSQRQKRVKPSRQGFSPTLRRSGYFLTRAFFVCRRAAASAVCYSARS